MDAEINDGQVSYALERFYVTNSEEERKRLHEWLNVVQGSPAMWSLAPVLLQSNRPVAVQFFGANCLYVKLCRSWQECSVLDVEQLRLFLLRELGFANETTQVIRAPMVLSRLSVVLAVFALQTAPDIWPNPVQDLISSGTRHTVTVLNVLAALPEEFRKLPAPLERRSVLRRTLHANVESIVTFITLVLQSDLTVDAEVFEGCITCVEGWLEFESDLADWEEVSMLCLNKLNSHLHPSLPAVARLFMQLGSNSALIQLPKFLQRLFEYSSSKLVPLIAQAIAEQAMDEHYTVVKMVVTLCENYSRILLESLGTQPCMSDCLRLLLDIAAMPGYYPTDEQCSELPLLFWCHLHEDVVHHEAAALLETRLEQLRPVYAELAQRILVKIRYPLEDIERGWSADDREMFRRYRIEQGDVLAACLKILGASPFLQAVLDLAGTDQSWQTIELVLFCFEAVGDCVVADNDVVIRLLTVTFPQLRTANEMIANAMLRVITKYSFCVTEGKLYTSVVPCVVPFTHNPLTSFHATLAMKDLVSDRDSALMPLSDLILAALYRCMDDHAITLRDRQRAMECVGYVLSLQTDEFVLAQLQRIIVPRLVCLRTLCAAEEPCNKNTIIEELDFISTLFGALSNLRSDPADPPAPTLSASNKPPIYLVLSECLESGLFESLFVRSQGDPDIVQRLCDIFKKALTSLLGHAAPLIPHYSGMITTLFTTAKPHEAALHLAKHLMLTFASDEAHQTDLAHLFNYLTDTTVALLTSSRSYLEAQDAYLLLCSQIAKKFSGFLLTTSCKLSAAIHVASVGMLQPEAVVLRQASQFLCELFKHNDAPSLVTAVEQRGSELFVRLFDRIKMEPLISSVEHIADVMFSLAKFYPQFLGTWMSQLPQHPLVGSMCRECSNKRKFRELAKRINIMCRKENLSL